MKFDQLFENIDYYKRQTVSFHKEGEQEPFFTDRVVKFQDETLKCVVCKEPTEWIWPTICKPICSYECIEKVIAKLGEKVCNKNQLQNWRNNIELN